MTGGLSVARLGRLHDAMTRHVESGRLAGAVTLVERRGDAVVDVVGNATLGGAPMRRDTIFRITSMTKPITVVAALTLVEECVLRLDDPVDALLPELANRRVLKAIDGPLDDTVVAERPITLRDLLTFRMGLGMVFGRADYPILKAIKELGILGFSMPDPAATIEPDEWLRRLGMLPLMAQPGSCWMYNTASCVLSVLVARASGKPLDTFLRERIFEPLGMRDTGFTVPDEKLDRFATSYWPDEAAGGLRLFDGVEDSAWRKAPAFPDGAAGLVSTIDDYLAFGRMLLNHGRHGRDRLLARPTVQAMTTDQLTQQQKAVSGFFPGYWDGAGWGFGVRIVTERDGIASVPGRYGWDGGYGTSWCNDPAEELVAILMTQRAEFPQFNPVWLDFWTGVYQAIDD